MSLLRMPLEMKLLLKNPAPGTFGSGYNWMSRAATGSMHDGLIRRAAASTHPAGTNGFDPFIVTPVISLRSPCRIRAVGTVVVCDNARSVRSQLVIAEEERPPLDQRTAKHAAGDVLMDGPFLMPARLLSHVLAFIASSRKNSNNVPRNWFDPCFTDALITAPAALPNSAEYVRVWTLNSCSASTGGATTCGLRS